MIYELEWKSILFSLNIGTLLVYCSPLRFNFDLFIISSKINVLQDYKYPSYAFILHKNSLFSFLLSFSNVHFKL